MRKREGERERERERERSISRQIGTETDLETDRHACMRQHQWLFVRVRRGAQKQRDNRDPALRLYILVGAREVWLLKSVGWGMF